MQIVNKFVATMDEMVELLDTDLTQANTEAIIDSVGTVCKVARQQMSTEAKVRSQNIQDWQYCYFYQISFPYI